MNKTVISIIVAAVLLLTGGIVYALARNTSDNSTTKTADHMMQDDAKNTETPTTGTAMSSMGQYVELADYQKNSADYRDSKIVYFFHAPWCPTCKSIDEAITNDPARIPKGVTIVKTDFDSETKLRQQYGVTTQYTFVQVDKDGNELKQWTASSLDAVIDGIL